jgi:hypothetical protein
MGAMFGGGPSPTPPPPAPKISDEEVAAAADKKRRDAAYRQGRAATFLTDPQAQRKAQANAQTYLSGV